METNSFEEIRDVVGADRGDLIESAFSAEAWNLGQRSVDSIEELEEDDADGVAFAGLSITVTGQSIGIRIGCYPDGAR
jgi:hypothetical protein